MRTWRSKVAAKGSVLRLCDQGLTQNVHERVVRIPAGTRLPRGLEQVGDHVDLRPIQTDPGPATAGSLSEVAIANPSKDRRLAHTELVGRLRRAHWLRQHVLDVCERTGMHGARIPARPA